MKKCTSCKKTKPLSEYHTRKASRGWYRPICKNCANTYANIYRIKNRQKAIEYAREYRIKNKEKVNKCKKRYLATRKGKEVKAKSLKKWQSKNKEKVKAHRLVLIAIKKGKLKRPKYCSKCKIKTSKIEGHHLNYLQPLNVLWLCTTCHKKKHNILLTAG